MAKQGNDLAQYILGFIYRKDDGVIKSYKASDNRSWGKFMYQINWDLKQRPHL